MEQIKIEALQQNCRYGTKDDIEKVTWCLNLEKPKNFEVCKSFDAKNQRLRENDSH